MIREKITLLLVGLMSFSPLSSLFAVICHGADGHVAVEAAVHNHCACPESGDVESNDDFTKVALVLAADHGHCNDTASATNFILSMRRNIDFSTHSILVGNPVLKSISRPSTFSFEHPAARSEEVTPFFAPLRAVILLS